MEDLPGHLEPGCFKMIFPASPAAFFLRLPGLYIFISLSNFFGLLVN